MKKKKSVFLTAVFTALLLLFAGCDMQFVGDIPESNPNVLPENPSDNTPQAVMPQRYLKLLNLPLDTRGQDVTATFVNDTSGQIARIDQTFDEIPIFRDTAAARTTVFVPLAGPQGEEFNSNGNFSVELRVFIDTDVSIVINMEHQVFVSFFAGRGELNLCIYRLQIYSPNLLQGTIRGFFNGGLVNPNDTAAPVIRAGTSFEMNGRFFNVGQNTPVTSMAPGADQRTQVLFLYAEAQTPTGVTFLLSHIQPFHDPVRRGWYAGQRRALFKMVFIRDTPDQFVAKTSIYDDFEHFDSYVINDWTRSLIPLAYWSLSGAGNPPPQTITLQAGIYIFELRGAGGGRGGNSNSVLGNTAPVQGGNGGTGGFIAELVILTEDTTFTAFTGQSGAHGSSGNQAFPTPNVGGHDFRRYEPRMAGAGGGGAVVSANTAGLNNHVVGSWAAGGGAGGSLGAGGAGGNSAAFAGSRTIQWSGYEGSGSVTWNFNISHAFGGTGGGFGGGTTSAIAAAAGQRGSLLGPANSFGFAGVPASGAGSGGQAAFSLFNNDTQSWKNTNNANGQGGRYGANGQNGGNNRNGSRGGGQETGGNGTIVIRQVI